MLIDTHCHLHDREFFSEPQAEEMIERAKKRGIEKIICIGTDPQDSLAARDFADKHENIYWTYGIHPESLMNPKQCFSETGSLAPVFTGLEPLFLASELRNAPQKTVSSSSPIAIGEVGLDYHYPGYDRQAQIRLFEEMLQLATEHDLPVSFHIREAFEDFFPVVSNFPKLRGVVHSFSDNKKNLRRILNETDFYVGVNGLATYSTLPTPPLERILLETDAPFLTPTPFRGIINESGYIREIAEWLSAKLATKFEIIEEKTTENAESLFRF